MRNPLSPLANNTNGDAMTSPVKLPTPTGAYDCDVENDNSMYFDLQSSPVKHATSPSKRSPLKYRLQDETIATQSPPDSPAQTTLRFNEGMTRALSELEQEPVSRKSSVNYTALNEDMSTIHQQQEQPDVGDIEIDLTLGLDRTVHDDTVGDMSTMSAIPTDLTRFANLRNSPTKTIPMDGWTPRANRNSIASATPATEQRPLQLLSRRSISSNEEEEATPRKPRHSNDSPVDLMNFTGQTNILIPPPGPTPRTTRRSPSGRGAFPIRVNPNPAHRSQASLEREMASGRSPQKQSSEQYVPATPSSRHQQSASANGLGLDLLDIDLGPMATPRSIPTVTPRELETLRSELQSRISGLEAALSGKEAEVSALKKAITDAEIRAGKTGEELRVSQQENEQIRIQKDDLDRRAREMEDVLREVKQNAFVEERERDKLKKLVEDAERRAEESEVKILELNASLDTLRQDRMTPSREPATPGSGSPVDVDAAVKNATETVARELHILYKSKHERKVADLKLSYEKRWLKQVDQLKTELKESQDQISTLFAERDGMLSGVLPGQSEALSKMEGQIEELRRWNEDLSAQKKVVEAEVAGARSELDTVRRENDQIRVDLEQERVEKGELVAQVEVFLSVSAEQEVAREAEKEAREGRERERQQIPVSPPRSDASGETVSTTSSNTGAPLQQIQSPNKRNGAVGVNGRPRPMSMLVKPTKIGSGIPAPGTSGLKQPGNRASVYQRGSLMDGIARMGAR